MLWLTTLITENEVIRVVAKAVLLPNDGISLLPSGAVTNAQIKNRMYVIILTVPKANAFSYIFQILTATVTKKMEKAHKGAITSYYPIKA
jgi:hypothetical protein